MTFPSPPRQDTAPGVRQEQARPAREPLLAPVEASPALDALGYSLSHDLRAPLRAIEGYLQALVEDFGTHLPLEARDVVSRIQQASHVVESRVDALLRLSQVSGTTPVVECCDLAAIAAPIVDDLRTASPGRQAVVTIAPAMLVDGDPALLGIVLENLLANAWKFTRTCETAVIDVDYRREPERVVVSVRDNGIGFDMAQAHRLGVPFQRLHAGSAYEGTGIGLASTIRILARHGGRLWAESAPGQGATFAFSLPLPRTC